jgi:hypothetical protein
MNMAARLPRAPHRTECLPESILQGKGDCVASATDDLGERVACSKPKRTE